MWIVILVDIRVLQQQSNVPSTHVMQALPRIIVPPASRSAKTDSPVTPRRRSKAAERAKLVRDLYQRVGKRREV
jgi:hypothetical protein